MSADLVQADSGGSPFDAIRRYTPEGREYWSARDLMPLLGYLVWRDFANAVQRARIACSNSGTDPHRHFAGARKVAASGPAAEDFHLSRYACYLVALNGDPRKPQIAAAQTYFVIKTRQAETAVGSPALTGPELLAHAVIEAQKIIAAKDERIAQLEPSAIAWDRLYELGADFEVDDAAKILSRDLNIKIGRDRLYEYMNSIDWIFRGRRGRWKAYQDQVELGRLKHRPGEQYWCKKTEQWRQGDPSVLITAKGLAELHQRLLRRSGQLELAVS
ncbi:phage antirepressor KilAC domain-containing protein [Mycobacterium sp. TY815]|uniref:phage antirepressor KilAC domain-containing protein n=1 Tax=Mycobacterium sp. TY815 TaxID=3050581 RepID=UPI0027415FCF|nr:phage antirepressor KilAC domain-containing protein [Mycobacterium sp. TY815]MDP7703239.1 phage antirepressor KilAC domain-containing protein [Mycobacterium sp. TY815]